jgi:Flp pilus assembly protein TadB
MSARLLLAGCLGLAGVVVLLPTGRRRATGGRLAVLSGPEQPRGPRDPRLLLAVLGGLAVALLIGGWWSVPIGAAVGLAVDRGLRRMEPAAVCAARLRAVADLPLAADLLAAALRAGTPVDRAVFAVGDAVGGPLGERFATVGRSLQLGGTPAEAWTHLDDVPGAARLTAAAVRSSASGGALATALVRLADELRSDRSVAAQTAAQRAGVLIVLPLGLCFLPAFVLAGLVPVVVAVLGDVL